jgi:hypothetical protein
MEEGLIDARLDSGQGAPDRERAPASEAA